MLQEMKDVTKSYWGLDIHLLSLNMSNEDQELKLLLLICISWEMICQAKQGCKFLNLNYEK